MFDIIRQTYGLVKVNKYYLARVICSRNNVDEVYMLLMLGTSWIFSRMIVPRYLSL